MKYWVFVFSLLLASGTCAQINFKVNISDQHLRKVEKKDDVKKKLKSYKKYYKKDSAAQRKQDWKAFKKQNKDSLKQEGRWKAFRKEKKNAFGERWKREKNRYKNRHKIDTAKFQPPEDSLEWALQQMARNQEFAQLQATYEEYAHYDSSYLERFNKDSLTISEDELMHRFKVKEKVAEYLPEDLVRESDFRINETAKYGSIDNAGNLIPGDHSGVRAFFQNIDPEQFAKAQFSMKEAKESYAVLPNLEKKEEGIKKHALEGVPFKKRVYVGGNIILQSTDPLILNNDIQVGYWANQKWLIGFGLVYREQFSELATNLTGDGYGYSFFSRYFINDNFFAVAQADQQQQGSLFKEGFGTASDWQMAAMIGVGREVRVGPVLLNTTILYDFNHNANSIHSRPFVVRMGYSLTKKPKL